MNGVSLLETGGLLRLASVFALGATAFGCTSSSSDGPPAASPAAPSSAAEAPEAEAESQTPQPESFTWPNSAGFAVSLTYDDAIATQRTLAAGQLAEYDVPATFFLQGNSTDLSQNRDRWAGLMEQGHELASHTMHHPCDQALDFVREGFAIQDYDLPRMEAELEETRALLRGLGAPEPYTFAYPCGETAVGEKRESYVPLIAGGFAAARGTVSGLANPAELELHSVPAFDGALSAEELVSLVQQAEAEGQWLVLVFHGVGGDYLTVELGAHEALLQELQRQAAGVWVAPFGEVARYVAERR